MFTKSDSKPFFLIRMCEKIETATVRLTLGGAYKRVEWPVPPNRDLDAAVPIPTGLVDALLEAVNHFSHARAPASAPSASPVKHRILHLHPHGTHQRYCQIDCSRIAVDYCSSSPFARKGAGRGLQRQHPEGAALRLPQPRGVLEADQPRLSIAQRQIQG